MTSFRFSVAAGVACAAVLAASTATAASLSVDFNALVLKGSAALPRESGNARSVVGTLAAGDFDCDGVDDIAVGDPGAEIASRFLGGSVSVAFGDRLLGLRAGGQKFNQNTSGVPDTAEDFDYFGKALAAADLDDDGCDDLVVGMPGETLGEDEYISAGAIGVFPGANGGLDMASSFFRPGTSQAPPQGPANYQGRGEALAVIQRFTSASSRPFLAVGVPGHSEGVTSFSGGVSVLRSSSATSLLSTPVMFLQRSHVEGQGNAFMDRLGTALTSGDFNGDGYGDLVSHGWELGGCPLNLPGCNAKEGYLLVTYGASSAANLHSERFHVDSPGIPGEAEANSFFGSVLAVGDFDDDGFDDLAVGAPDASAPGLNGAMRSRAGVVWIFFGGSNGLYANRSRSYRLVQTDFANQLSATDRRFGAALATGDFNRDGRDDLAIGVPGETVGGAAKAGLVLFLTSGSNGPRAQGAQEFHLGLAGMQGNPAANDGFGSALMRGDFNDDNLADLAIGVHARKDASGDTQGALSLVFSSSDTVTNIGAITPAAGSVGQPFTITVTARRTPAVGLPLGRGRVRVEASNGDRCFATLSSNGIGTCQLPAFSAGTLTLVAHYEPQIGFRASRSTAVQYVIAPNTTDLFSNGFESP